MKKKHLVMIATAILMVTTMNLQAQEGPNGTGPGNATSNSWIRSGNQIDGGANRLGSTDGYPIRFCTNNYDRVFVSVDGKVGINTNNPLQKLHILDGNILISRSFPDELGSANGTIYFGDQVSPSEPYGKWGIEYVSSEREGYGLNFWKPAVTGQNHGNYYLFLADTGNVGIGTNNPLYKLSVNGTILAKEIRVNEDASYWPDFVFDKDYELMGLTEVKKFVSKYKHLPCVPSAAEIEGKDMSLGEMNKILLQKIEELTLYVIDLQDQIDTLKEVGKE